MNKKLYLLRHGETEFNQKGIYQGTLDSNLTTFGVQQVKDNALLLKQKIKNIPDENIAFFASPLGRAKQSAQIIYETVARKGVYPIEEDHLKEVDIGLWNGKNKVGIQKENPQIDCNEYDWYFKSPNGERYSDVFSRCESWLKQIEQIEPQHIIIMSHGLLGRVLRGYLLKLSYDETITLDVSQTGFFILEKGQVEFVTNDFELY